QGDRAIGALADAVVQICQAIGVEGEVAVRDLRIGTARVLKVAAAGYVAIFLGGTFLQNGCDLVSDNPEVKNWLQSNISYAMTAIISGGTVGILAVGAQAVYQQMKQNRNETAS